MNDTMITISLLLALILSTFLWAAIWLVVIIREETKDVILDPDIEGD